MNLDMRVSVPDHEIKIYIDLEALDRYQRRASIISSSSALELDWNPAAWIERQGKSLSEELGVLEKRNRHLKRGSSTLSRYYADHTVEKTFLDLAKKYVVNSMPVEWETATAETLWITLTDGKATILYQDLNRAFCTFFLYLFLSVSSGAPFPRYVPIHVRTRYEPKASKALSKFDRIHRGKRYEELISGETLPRKDPRPRPMAKHCVESFLEAFQRERCILEQGQILSAYLELMVSHIEYRQAQVDLGNLLKAQTHLCGLQTAETNRVSNLLATITLESEFFEENVGEQEVILDLFQKIVIYSERNTAKLADHTFSKLEGPAIFLCYAFMVFAHYEPHASKHGPFLYETAQIWDRLNARINSRNPKDAQVQSRSSLVTLGLMLGSEHRLMQVVHVGMMEFFCGEWQTAWETSGRGDKFQELRAKCNIPLNLPNQPTGK